MEKGLYPNRLYILRKARCMQQDEVCNAIAVNKKTLYNYERCITPIPSDKLVEFAKLYECSTDHILYVEPIKQPEVKKLTKSVIEESTAKFCDEYCKFPSMAVNEEQLDDICSKCPMNELFDIFYSSENGNRKEILHCTQNNSMAARNNGE